MRNILTFVWIISMDFIQISFTHDNTCELIKKEVSVVK